MPKGYISFEEFKINQNVKSRVQKCPRCHKPMDIVMHNYWGKPMCLNCYTIEQERNSQKKVRDISEKESDLALIEAEIEYNQYER